MKLTDIDTYRLSMTIERHERAVNGLDSFPLSTLQVLNLHVDEGTVTADIVIQPEPGEAWESLPRRKYPAKFFYGESTPRPGWLHGVENLTMDEMGRVFWRGNLVECISDTVSPSIKGIAESLGEVCRGLEAKGREVCFREVMKEYVEIYRQETEEGRELLTARWGAVAEEAEVDTASPGC